MAKNKELKYKFKGEGLSRKEKNWAKKRFQTYRDNHQIYSFNELDLLEELVFVEAILIRFKLKVEELGKNEQSRKEEIVPKDILDRIDGLNDRRLELKEKLGLFTKEEEKSSWVLFKTWLSQFKLWLGENQLSRVTKCPKCGFTYILKMRTDAYEESKFPYFEDHILFNKHLWKIYKEGKIDKWDVAKVLQGEDVTSTKYIDWLEDQIDRRSKKAINEKNKTKKKK